MANLRSFLPLLVPLIFFFIQPFTSADKVYNIVSFGAKPEGQTDSAKALLGAWSVACGSPVPATIYVPSGRFLISQAAMSGPCKSSKTTIQIDGTLVAPSGYSDGTDQWITFEHVDGLSVVGGTIDGRGGPLWECKSKGHGCPDGATVGGDIPSSYVVKH